MYFKIFLHDFNPMTYIGRFSHIAEEIHLRSERM